jgi:hypothetical protein
MSGPQSTTDAGPAEPQNDSMPTSDERLSMPAYARIPVVTTFGALSGFFLGVAHGGQMAGLRFRAEHAHKLPTTPVGWYLYHKSKNYNVALGGVKEGLRMAGKVGFWCGAFFCVEEVIDRARDGRKDLFSTVVAGLTAAGGFSAWSWYSLDFAAGGPSGLTTVSDRFPPLTAARTAKIGLVVGIAFGLMQDALSLVKGQRLGYVDFLLRKTRPEGGLLDETR